MKRLSGDDDPSTSDRNSVSFHPDTPEFTRLEYVQQTSISIGVSFTRFAGGQHYYTERATRQVLPCMFSLYSLQPGGAVTRRYGRPVRTEDISSAADIKAGTIHAGVAIPAGGHAAYDGQCRHVLCIAHPLHLHLQVSSRFIGLSSHALYRPTRHKIVQAYMYFLYGSVSSSVSVCCTQSLSVAMFVHGCFTE